MKILSFKIGFRTCWNILKTLFQLLKIKTFPIFLTFKMAESLLLFVYEKKDLLGKNINIPYSIDDQQDNRVCQEPDCNKFTPVVCFYIFYNNLSFVL